MRLTLICLAGIDWNDWMPRNGDGWHASPLLWPDDLGVAAGAATLATGTLPERHGVVGDDEGWALGVRPVSQASWRVQPFWAALAAAGLKIASLDWPGSAPAGGWPGLHVDDRYAAATGHSFDNWAVPLGALPGEIDALRDLRIHPADLRAEQLRPIVPKLEDIDQDRTHSIERAARALARAATTQAAALHILATADCDFLAVHFRLPEELRGIGDAQVDAAGGLTFVRAAIERLRTAAPDRAIAIVGHALTGEAGFIATHGLPTTAPVRVTDLAEWFTAAFRQLYAPQDTPPLEDSVDPRGRGYALAPGPPVAWQASRLALFARQLLPRAPGSSRQLVEQALAAVPDNIDALRVQALCDAAAEASASLAITGERLEVLAPGAPWGSLARALADGFGGDKASATSRLTALDAGNDQRLWSLIGAAWLTIGDTSRAEAAFARAPNRTDALLGTVQAKLAKRDFRVAETLLNRALDRHPVSRAALILLAQLYDDLGRNHEAMAARQRVDALSFS